MTEKELSELFNKFAGQEVRNPFSATEDKVSAGMFKTARDNGLNLSVVFLRDGETAQDAIKARKANMKKGLLGKKPQPDHAFAFAEKGADGKYRVGKPFRFF